MPRPDKRLKAADRRLLQRVFVNIAMTPPVGALEDGEPAEAPNPEGDPTAYVRHVGRQSALRNYTMRMLAKLLSGDLTAAERERWGRGVIAFLEPFFRGQKNKREGRSHGPIKRRENGKRDSIIAEWMKLKAQGTPDTIAPASSPES